MPSRSAAPWLTTTASPVVVQLGIGAMKPRQPRVLAGIALLLVVGATAQAATRFLFERQQLAQEDRTIVQTGMGWVSGAQLTAATANAGGLGILAAAVMSYDELAQAIDENHHGVSTYARYVASFSRADAAFQTIGTLPRRLWDSSPAMQPQTRYRSAACSAWSSRSCAVAGDPCPWF